MLEIKPGNWVGPYKVIKPLKEEARGAMATLFLAQLVQPEGTQLVVLKVVPTEEEGAQERLNALRKEVGILQKLRHPNIVKIFPIPSRNKGRREGYISRATNVRGNPWYCALEYLKGDDLRSRLQELGTLPLEEAVEIAYQIGSALDYMHSKGYVHWDVKPENISFRYELSEEGKIEAVLTDFGIARGTHEPAEVTGTVDYMSPERLKVHMREIPPDQITDQRPADVYALGAVLYEMLVGNPPFVAEDEEALKYAILEEQPEPLPPFIEVPAMVEEIIFQALEKDPANRPTMEEMVTMLDRAAPLIRIGLRQPPPTPEEEEEEKEEEKKAEEVVGPKPSPILHFLKWSFATALVVALAMALFVGGVQAGRFAGLIPPLTPPPTPVTVTPATPTPIPPTPTPMPTPIVSSIIPKSASTDEGSVTVTIEGGNFRDTPKVFVGSIECTGVRVFAEGRGIQCSLPVADAEPGKWDVWVINPDKTSGELADAFDIIPPPTPTQTPTPTATPTQTPTPTPRRRGITPTPTPPPPPPEIRGVAPNSMRHNTAKEVTITGKNLSQCTRVLLIGPAHQVSASTIQVIDDSQIRCRFDLSGITVPWDQEWRLRVEGPGGPADAVFYVVKGPPPTPEKKEK